MPTDLASAYDSFEVQLDTECGNKDFGILEECMHLAFQFDLRNISISDLPAE